MRRLLVICVLGCWLLTACQQNREGETVPTETAVTQPTLCLQVIDEGPGIAPENYQRIFDKYEVITLKKTGQEQLGLGLAFCKMVVEAHGGQIFASANSPNGAVFTIEL